MVSALGFRLNSMPFYFLSSTIDSFHHKPTLGTSPVTTRANPLLINISNMLTLPKTLNFNSENILCTRYDHNTIVSWPLEKYRVLFVMDGVVDAAERQPLLYKPAIVLPNSATSTTKRDTPFIDENGKIDFDPQGDVNNPIDWPKSYKNGVTWLLAFMAFTVFVPYSHHLIFCISLLFFIYQTHVIKTILPNLVTQLIYQQNIYMYKSSAYFSAHNRLPELWD